MPPKPSLGLDPREKGWSSEHVGLWDPSQTGSSKSGPHTFRLTFGWGRHVLREVEAVLCKTLTKSYFKCKMERNINIAPFARARARTHTHTGTSEKKEIQVSSIFKAGRPRQLCHTALLPHGGATQTINKLPQFGP